MHLIAFICQNKWKFPTSELNYRGEIDIFDGIRDMKMTIFAILDYILHDFEGISISRAYSNDEMYDEF